MESATYEYTGKLLELLSIENCLTDRMRSKMNERAREFLENLKPDASNFLRHSLDSEKHSEEVTRTLVRAVPGILLECDGMGNLPIHNSAFWESRSGHLIPVLTEEGMRLNVGGNNGRGGLLVPNELGDNVFQCLCQPIAGQSLRLAVLKKLREKNLFKNDDIRKHNLLQICFDHNAWDIANYLIDCDKELFKIWKSGRGYSVLQLSIASNAGTLKFEVLFPKAFRVYPEELGLLFQTNPMGESTLHMASRSLGITKVFNMVVDCIAEITKDKQEALIQMNPKTRLYPFMLAAASGGGTETLNVIYHLLNHNPTIALSAIEVEFDKDSAPGKNMVFDKKSLELAIAINSWLKLWVTYGRHCELPKSLK